MANHVKFITPDWDVPGHVKARVTLRSGGYSEGNYQSLNLACHVGDNREHVKRNRQLLQQEIGLPSSPQWLDQVHSSRAVELKDKDSQQVKTADAAYTKLSQCICVVLTADCLPIFMYHPRDNCIAVVHAGWRGLAKGIIKNTVCAMTSSPENIIAWLGPAIGPDKFEVGEEVRDIFCNHDIESSISFKTTNPRNGKLHYLADIYRLATRQLYNTGVISVSGGGFCTMSNAEYFYSYRRDGETGRMASLIWLEDY